jgi:hypothetical protein
MGTHCNIYCYDNGVLMMVIYSQYDGYPSGIGAMLGYILKKITIVNGIPMPRPDHIGDIANGAGCLYAQLVAIMKKIPGDIYIMAPDSVEEQYNYDINVIDEKIKIRCRELAEDYLDPKDFYELVHE